MPQTTNRFFDEIAKLMTDATGAAQGVRGEIDNLVRSQAERVLRDLDLVQREEFEAMKAMALKAREENARLEKRIGELEDALSRFGEGRSDNLPHTAPHTDPHTGDDASGQ